MKCHYLNEKRTLMGSQFKFKSKANKSRHQNNTVPEPKNQMPSAIVKKEAKEPMLLKFFCLSSSFSNI